jgi:ATP-dependent protease ClpP protease subunit
MGTALRDGLEEQKLRAEIAKLEAEGDLAIRELTMKRRSNWDRRCLDFFFPVQESTVREAVKVLSEWSATELPITIRLNSPGGLVSDGLAFHDYLRSLREAGQHITIIALGEAASMACVIFQAATRRVIAPNTDLLIHEISAAELGGRASEIAEYADYLKSQQKKLLAILAERSTMSERQIANRWIKTDWWLGAEESVRLGFADEVALA